MKADINIVTVRIAEIPEYQGSNPLEIIIFFFFFFFIKVASSGEGPCHVSYTFRNNQQRMIILAS